MDRESWADDCRLRAQGRRGGACSVQTGDQLLPACVATLRRQVGKPERLIEAVHLSRPENYLSIYQSGCNFACRKCHSWQFSQKSAGLKHVRLGNIGVFARTEAQLERLAEATGRLAQGGASDEG